MRVVIKREWNEKYGLIDETVLIYADERMYKRYKDLKKE